MIVRIWVFNVQQDWLQTTASEISAAAQRTSSNDAVIIGEGSVLESESARLKKAIELYERQPFH